MKISGLFLILFLTLAIAPQLALASQSTSSVRAQTMNSAESAPLNQVGRLFSRIETNLSDSTGSQKLNYRLFSREPKITQAALESSLREMLLNIWGGSDQATIKTLEVVSNDEKQIRSAVKAFTRKAEFVDTLASADETEELSVIAKGAMARPDMRLFQARVIDAHEDSSVLVLVDEESSELLLLSLSSLL